MNTDTYGRVFERLREFANESHNWDGKGGLPASKETAKEVRLMLESLKNVGILPPSLSLSNTGAVSLIWKSCDDYYHAYVRVSGSSFFAAAYEDGDSVSVSDKSKQLDSFVEFLHENFREEEDNDWDESYDGMHSDYSKTYAREKKEKDEYKKSMDYDSDVAGSIMFIYVVLAVFLLSLLGFLGYLIYHKHYVDGDLSTVTSMYRDYRVIGIDQPKHFYVDLVDVKTGEKHGHVYVSKHCNKWRNLRTGSEWRLRYRLSKYEISGRTVVTIDTKPLYQEICK